MFGVRSGFACVGCASFKHFWHLALVQQALAALLFVVRGLCGHFRFCALGLTGVLLWGLMSLAMWAVSAFAYFRNGEVDVGSSVMAVFFTAALGLAFYSARRTGLKC